MATRFSQLSEEYLRQIDAEVERLHQLRTQVQSVVQSESALEQAEPAVKKRAYTRRRTAVPPPEKTATKRSYVRRVPLPAKKVAAKKRAAKKSTRKAAAEPSA